MSQIADLEALLFVVGEEGISLNDLSFFLNDTTDQIYNSIQLLNQNYISSNSSALTILEIGGKYMLSTKQSFSELLKDFSKSPISSRLSQAALEVLSIVAYNQPITRLTVEQIRGVNSSGILTKLQNLDLIEEKGRESSIGKPILYGTTFYFMDYFGLKNLDELPSIDNNDITLHEEETDLFFDGRKENRIEET